MNSSEACLTLAFKASRSPSTSFDRRAANRPWVTLTFGTLTRKPTALDLAPAVCVATPTPLLGSMGSCVADSASVAMPRKSDSSSTAEEFIGCEVGRALFKYEYQR
ncbi:hypothetical protein GQ457_13G007110 [Hibiscus cannabinus]